MLFIFHRPQKRNDLKRTTHFLVIEQITKNCINALKKNSLDLSTWLTSLCSALHLELAITWKWMFIAVSFISCPFDINLPKYTHTHFPPNTTWSSNYYHSAISEFDLWFIIVINNSHMIGKWKILYLPIFHLNKRSLECTFFKKSTI